MDQNLKEKKMSYLQETVCDEMRLFGQGRFGSIQFISHRIKIVWPSLVDGICIDTGTKREDAQTNDGVSQTVRPHDFQLEIGQIFRSDL